MMTSKKNRRNKTSVVGGANGRLWVEGLENRTLFATFSAYGDFSPLVNPNGAWSYGENSGSGFVLDAVPASGASGYAGSGTTGTTSAIQANATTQSLVLKPGNPNFSADVRWTAPAAGNYSITGSFTDSTGAASTSVHVLLNGTALVTGAINPGGTSSVPINQSSVTVSAGATIDFVVGAGSQGYSTIDQTALQATISTIAVTTNNGSITPTVTGKLPTKPFVSGQKITPFYQTVKLTNTSTKTITGSESIILELASTPQGEFGDPTIASTSHVGPLPVNRPVPVPILIRSLPADTSGTFYILASVTDPAGNVSTVPSAGTITMELPRHDLTAALTAGLQRRVMAGRNILIPVIVTNDGNLQANTTIAFDIVATGAASSIDLGTVSHRVLVNPAGRELIVLVESVPAIAAAGTYTLSGSIDPNFAYNDVTVTNNTFASTLTVTVVG